MNPEIDGPEPSDEEIAAFYREHPCAVYLHGMYDLSEKEVRELLAEQKSRLKDYREHYALYKKKLVESKKRLEDTKLNVALIEDRLLEFRTQKGDTLEDPKWDH
jgi:hypothetical protein